MPRLFLIAASLLWSTSGAFTKILALPGPVTACYRVLFAGLVLLPFVRRRHVRFRPAIVGMVTSFALMNYCFVSAMVETSAANAIFLQYTAPIWIFLASVFLLKEPLDRASLVTSIIGLCGIAVLIAGKEAGDTRGIVLALLSGVFYAGVAVFLRFLRDENPLYLTTLNLLVSGLVLLPFVQNEIFPTGGKLVGLIAFGAFQMAAPYVLFSYALKGISAQEAAVITLIEPVLNPVWAYLAVGERPAMTTIIGGGIILGGIAVQALIGNRLRRCAS